MKNKIILLSYYPLLRPNDLLKAGTYLTDNWDQEIADTLQLNTPNCEGVLYVPDDDWKPGIVFIMEDRSKEIADHLLEWCENDLSWFTLCFKKKGESYGVLICPDIKRSVFRSREATRTIEAEDYSVIYQPITCFCPTSNSYDMISGLLPMPLAVGFLDIDKVDQDNLGNTDFDSISWIGNIEVGDSELGTKHLDMILNERS